MAIVLIMLAMGLGVLALVAFGDRLFESNRTRHAGPRPVAPATTAARPDEHAVVWRTLVGAGQD